MQISLLINKTHLRYCPPVQAFGHTKIQAARADENKKYLTGNYGFILANLDF